jgi:soluble lytic murein transglycosylase-like protein
VCIPSVAVGLSSVCNQIRSIAHDPPSLAIIDASWVPEVYETCEDRRDEPVYVAPATYRGMGSDVEQWRDLVAGYFGDKTDLALCIIKYESGGNPNAANPNSSARGLFQVMASTWAAHFGVSWDQLYDPATNTAIAWEIYQIQGWGAWAVYNKGMC